MVRRRRGLKSCEHIQSADKPGYCRFCDDPVTFDTPFYPGQEPRAARERALLLWREAGMSPPPPFQPDLSLIQW